MVSSHIQDGAKLHVNWPIGPWGVAAKCGSLPRCGTLVPWRKRSKGLLREGKGGDGEAGATSPAWRGCRSDLPASSPCAVSKKRTRNPKKNTCMETDVLIECMYDIEGDVGSPHLDNRMLVLCGRGGGPTARTSAASASDGQARDRTCRSVRGGAVGTFAHVAARSP